jgi:peptide deformylase
MSSPKDNIITLPNEHLRQPSRKVGLVTDEIKKIILEMQAATMDWEDSRDHEVAVALAAVQIDHHFRVIILRGNFDDRDDRSFQIFINPEITKHEGEIVEDYEGCLSILDIYGKVKRYNKVRVKAQDINGREFRVTAEGFLARVFQHEIDHTKGIVFIDHIKDDPEAFYKLNNDGKLEALDYEQSIKNNRLLW